MNTTPETIRIRIENVGRQPRGFHDAAGRVKTFDPGESDTVTVTASTYDRLSSRSTWEIDTIEHGVMAAAKAPGAENDVAILVNGEKAAKIAMTSMEPAVFAEFYERVSGGKKPHHNAKRETLISHLIKSE